MHLNLKTRRLAATLLACLMGPALAADGPPRLMLTGSSAADPADIALDYLHGLAASRGMHTSDLEHRVTDRYRSPHNGVTHIYMQQMVEGIPVHPQVSGFHVMPDGRMLTVSDHFVADAVARRNRSEPVLEAAQAVLAAARSLGVDLDAPPPQLRVSGGAQRGSVFAGDTLSDAEIPVELTYELVDGQLRLAWRMVIDRFRLHGLHVDLRIDAETGAVIGESHWAAHSGVSLKGGPETGTRYRVYAAPLESPDHPGAAATLEADPHHPDASPRGWHDSRTSGDGFQFTDTRGNNVLAQADLTSTNTSTTRPSGVVDGNPDLLVFDYPLDHNAAPTVTANVNAAVTNLFYWNNHLHDVLWVYGFNEPAGNFQQNNFGRGGAQNDAVRADALDGASNNPPNANNANFSTPPDGSPARMQMFMWLAPNLVVRVDDPFEANYIAQGASFGPALPEGGIEGELVPVDDGSGENGIEGCAALVNGAAISGNIAVIRRGSCEFGLKALNAQQAGAAAVVIFNNQGDATVGMGPGAQGGLVTVPTVSIGQGSGEAIVAASPTVEGAIVPSAGTIPNRDSDFDAGIIAHEYGHGLSIRLTGGPGTSGCLSGSEQAGEGWSDFLGLVTTMRADSCEVPRGIGTYPSFQPWTGPGIRRHRYTRDMAINPFTYGDIADPGLPAPHGVGTVWATALWDMTCDLIDEYGMETDLFQQEGGVAVALQLVVDGLKLQSCNPTFVTARNAILAADQANHDGAHRCLIWKAFARRGIGFSAIGGTNQRGDEVPAFDIPEDCVVVLPEAIFADGFEPFDEG
ncbi:MAG TPA: M36 family metallopeptidase [Xanthomonadaceae bacterium]|nr:M36 family metallopeptidase [Xanthomonadaceae bacterium]